MQYRPEIDGLRFLAVIPVLLFHAGFTVFQGGYVGVDVFFVISGFLITNIIISELQAEKFSIGRFYERRFRRILPVLLFVIICCLILGWFILPPRDMRQFLESVFGAATFSSNITFWLQSGYFDTQSELKPLLHTWSLAVEEQYYILYPLLLMVIWKWRSVNVALFLALIMVLSLLLADLTVEENASAAFYLLPYRAWELMLGGIAAIYVKETQSPLPENMKSVLATIGLLAIIASIFFITPTTPYPSNWTMIPVLGTFLVLVFSSSENLVGKLMSWKIFVRIGLISYGTYLWHQPAFAFAKLSFAKDIHPGEALHFVTYSALIGFSLLLAQLTYWFVETPFRKGKYLFWNDSRSVIQTSLIFCASLAVISAGMIHFKTPTYIELKHPELFNQIADQSTVQTTIDSSADCPAVIPKVEGVVCTSHGTGTKQVIVWGDSHANRLRLGLPSTSDLQIIILSHVGCPPLIGVRRFDGIGNAVNCNDVSFATQFAESIMNLEPDLVVLVGRWSLYTNGWQQNGVLNRSHHYVTDRTRMPRADLADQSYWALRSGLLQTVRKLTGVTNLIILSQPPDYGWASLQEMQTSNFVASRSRVDEWHSLESSLIASVTDLPGVDLIEVKDLFCSTDTCQTRRNGKRLYQDDNHVSEIAARFLWDLIIEAFESDAAAVSSEQNFLEISINEVAAEIAEGVKWNAPGHIIIPETGLIVALEEPVRSRAIALGLDGNDVYQIEIVGEVNSESALLQPNPIEGGGISRRRAEFPETILVKEVFIKPISGDGYYSLSAIELEQD